MCSYSSCVGAHWVDDSGHEEIQLLVLPLHHIFLWNWHVHVLGVGKTLDGLRMTGGENFAVFRVACGQSFICVYISPEGQLHALHACPGGRRVRESLGEVLSEAHACWLHLKKAEIIKSVCHPCSEHVPLRTAAVPFLRMSWFCFEAPQIGTGAVKEFRAAE